MLIDFNHWQGSQIGNDISQLISQKGRLDIISALQPKFSKDGNQFCYLYGELPNDCIAGFGDTPVGAMEDFVNNFYNQKATK